MVSRRCYKHKQASLTLTHSFVCDRWLIVSFLGVNVKTVTADGCKILASVIAAESWMDVLKP